MDLPKKRDLLPITTIDSTEKYQQAVMCMINMTM